jgi:5-oxopent-3-ene-1,2,5-tricarboxylate decarboxylase / 2-hydroxyhepta-2,4-diene-1,7-dioate isomerase
MLPLGVKLVVPPYRLSGVVYGALLNHSMQLASMGDALAHAPYQAAPIAPVLAMKPRNTLAGDGAAFVVPKGVDALELGASLAIVIGHVACRVPLASALDHVAGYTIANDVAIPLESHYRPAVRFRARDGFCALGPRVVPAAAVPEPDALAVRVLVDGIALQETSTGDRVRGVAQLITDVTEFMTLLPGDVLLLGASAFPPKAHAGQAVSVFIGGLGVLYNHVVSEEEPA